MSDGFCLDPEETWVVRVAISKALQADPAWGGLNSSVLLRLAYRFEATS